MEHGTKHLSAEAGSTIVLVIFYKICKKFMEKTQWKKNSEKIFDLLKNRLKKRLKNNFILFILQ